MGRRSMFGALLAAMVLAIACGGSDGTSDGSTGDATGADGAVASSADIPWLADGVPAIAPPVLSPCPEGWRLVAASVEGDPDTCDPYPEGGAVTCPEGQAHFPGEAGCAPVGSPCPAGDFSTTLPTDRRVVYVRPGASMGDGSESSPYGSLTEFSFGALPLGTVIALSRGRHAGPVRLTRGHELVGACAEATEVATSVLSEVEGVVTFVGTGGGLRDLSLSTSPRPGVWLSGTGIAAQMQGVIVAETRHLGVAVGRGAQLSMQSVVVRDTASGASSGRLGRGLTVERDATVDVSRAVFSRNRSTGAYASDPATIVALSDVAIRDTMGQAGDDRFGRGVGVELGATMELRRTLLSTNHQYGAYVNGSGSTLHSSDAWIHGTRSQANDGTSGRGLSLQGGAIAELNRVLVSENREVAVFSVGADTVLRTSDLAIVDTRSRSADGVGGRGLSVQAGASVEAVRLLVRRNRSTGVFGHDADAMLALTDAVVRDTDGDEIDGRFGRGLTVQHGASADLVRVLVSDTRELGIFATEAGVLSATDVVVRETDGAAGDGFGGRGLGVELGATADMRRALFAGNLDVGVSVLAGGAAMLEDVIVSDTRPRVCAETTCAEAGAGHGVGSYEPGTVVRMTRFSVRGSALCGVHVAGGADLDLASGDVRGNAIGACVQVDGYDVARLMTSVRYEDNGVNLQSTSLPIPERGDVSSALDP